MYTRGSWLNCVRKKSWITFDMKHSLSGFLAFPFSFSNMHECLHVSVVSLNPARTHARNIDVLTTAQVHLVWSDR